MPLDVCLVTGTRADWGLLRAPARLMRDDPAFRLTVVATGTHLSQRFGNTVDEIRRDGFEVARQVPILEEADDEAATVRAMARATSGFAEVLEALVPDVVMLLGDRYEILGVAQACLLMRVPVVHLCGGDVTEGAFDDAIRHAISKLAHLHFPTNAQAARRLVAMGETPDRVILAGSTGLDTIRETQPLSREETFSRLGLPPASTAVLVTFHPPTLDETPAQAQFEELAAALEGLDPSVAVILTGSNADPAGRQLSDLAERFAATRPNSAFRMSLGQTLYLSVMRYVRAVVGNSSSGLYEAPSFGVATVNIGDRQAGRPRASSVIDVPPERGAIADALSAALAGDYSGAVNPYGDGHAAPRIVASLRALADPRKLLRKTFYMGEGTCSMSA